MFPQGNTEIMRDLMHLDYTMRILPHDQNSGGFYVALFRKKGYVCWNRRAKFEDWGKHSE